jgi:hypothetical protein
MKVRTGTDIIIIIIIRAPMAKEHKVTHNNQVSSTTSSKQGLDAHQTNKITLITTQL